MKLYYKKLLFFIIFYFCIALSVSAEILNKISINGNQRITNETIVVYGDINLKKNLTSEDVNKITNKLFETEFFKDVQIKFENNELIINVVEHPIINSIIIEGEKVSKFQEQILESISSREKSSYIKSKVLKDTRLVKKMYDQLGFSLSSIETKIDDIGEKRINLTFIVDRGKKIKISKINFIGEKKIKERRLRDIIVSEENKFWKFLSKNVNYSETNIKLDERLLTNYYKSNGYYDIQIISTTAEVLNSDNVSLTYNISAGNRFIISKVSSNVDPVLDQKIFKGLSKSYKKIIGDYYSPFKIKKLLDNLDELIFENELQFIEHNVKESKNDNTIEITVNIFEGSKLLVEKISIKGNNITRENVIRSELLLDEGDPFNQLKLDKSIAKLKGRNIFGNVSHVVTESEIKNNKLIEIEIEEKPTGEISAGAGVGTDGGSIQFGVVENNFLGKGLRLNTSVLLDADTFKGSLDMVQPNFNYSGNALMAGISSTTNNVEKSGYKNSITSTHLGTSFEQYKDIYFSPQLSLASDKLTVDSTASQNLKNQAGTFNEFYFDYGFTKDVRDRAFQPTDGYRASFNQGLPLYADSKTIFHTISLSAYESFTENVVGSAKLNILSANNIDNQDTRLSKRVSLPSTKLRGFKSGQIGPKDGNDYVGGNYATAVNFEGSLPNLVPEAFNTDVSLFLDFGNVWGVDYSDTIDDSNTIRSSTGINANWLSPIGPFSFTFSKDLLKADTDKTETFKFNLGTTF